MQRFRGIQLWLMISSLLLIVANEKPISLFLIERRQIKEFFRTLKMIEKIAFQRL
jgi:hypothetical protein